MIVFDTEGTDLLKPEIVPLSQQPHLVEFAGIKLHPTSLEEQERLHFVCNPGLPLPETFTKITGIQESDVKDQPAFETFYLRLVDFFLGQKQMAAHNLGYDAGVLKFSLMRMDRLLKFPWPPGHICTVELTRGLYGHNLSMSDLYNLTRGIDKDQRQEFRVGGLVKHASLGKCELLEMGEKMFKVRHLDSGNVKLLKREMFKAGSAFEGAHGAMKDAEELVTIVRWLRKEGLL